MYIINLCFPFVKSFYIAGLLDPADTEKQGVSVSPTPVYSELWFILLFALLGLFLLALLLGLILRRYLSEGHF